MYIKMVVLATLFATQGVGANANAADLSFDFNSTLNSTLNLSGGAAVGQFGWTPIGGSGDYLVAPVGGVAVLDFADNTYNQLNFLWGSVDFNNKLELLLSNHTTYTLTGGDLIGTSPVIRTLPYSFNAGALFVNKVTFSNTGWGGFEVDDVSVKSAPVDIDFSLTNAGGFTGGRIETGSELSVKKAPRGDFGAYYLVGIDQTATIDLVDNLYKNISFLWGSVDDHNSVEFLLSDGTKKTVVGTEVALDDGTVDTLFSFNSGGLFVNSVKFVNVRENGFEFDNFVATPVPEPESFAMMLFGFGLLGFARRRNLVM